MVRSLSSWRWLSFHTGNYAPFSIVSFGRMFSDRVRGNIMVVRPYSELSDIGQVETGGIYRTLAFGFQLQVCRRNTSWISRPGFGIGPVSFGDT
jgi:hypothetical protein